MNQAVIPIPSHLPFLQAICWEMASISDFTLDEMLSRYERGWVYRGILAEVVGEELAFVRVLAEMKGSWLLNDVSI